MSKNDQQNDGGPAFPVSTGTGPLSANFVAPGMSLRDYFAAAALQGFLSMYAGPDCGCPNPEKASIASYDFADAMLKARNQ